MIYFLCLKLVKLTCANRELGSMYITSFSPTQHLMIHILGPVKKHPHQINENGDPYPIGSMYGIFTYI